MLSPLSALHMQDEGRKRKWGVGSKLVRGGLQVVMPSCHLRTCVYSLLTSFFLNTKGARSGASIGDFSFAI